VREDRKRVDKVESPRRVRQWWREVIRLESSELQVAATPGDQPVIVVATQNLTGQAVPVPDHAPATAAEIECCAPPADRVAVAFEGAAQAVGGAPPAFHVPLQLGRSRHDEDEVGGRQRKPVQRRLAPIEGVSAPATYGTPVIPKAPRGRQDPEPAQLLLDRLFQPYVLTYQETRFSIRSGAKVSPRLPTCRSLSRAICWPTAGGILRASRSGVLFNLNGAKRDGAPAEPHVSFRALRQCHVPTRVGCRLPTCQGAVRSSTMVHRPEGHRRS